MGQNAVVSGVVKDSIDNPLPFANILARPQAENNSMSYAIADERGRYILNLQTNTAYEVSVSFMGYQKQLHLIKIEQSTIRDFVLKPDNNELYEIVINIDLPVIVKRDTILYDATAFATGEERKLKQILKKLPGVEVDRSGNVQVNGKKVTKLMVDGKTFFDGSTKLGIENIPADVVESVEVIDNYNEVGFLKGLNDSERMAMDIKLKKNKKHFYFGDLEAGLGTDQHYAVHPSIFYYSPKTKMNLIADFNDVGVKSFTISDYINFEGGIGKLMNTSGSTFQLSNDDFSKFLMNTDFYESDNKFSAFNINHTISNKTDLGAYIIYSDAQSKSWQEQQNQYFTEEQDVLEQISRLGKHEDQFVIGKVNLDYKPNMREDISYSGFVKSSKNQHNENLNTRVDTSENVIFTFLDEEQVQTKQNLEWHKKVSAKQTFSFTLNYKGLKNDSGAEWNSQDVILDDYLPVIPDDYYEINQNEQLTTHNLDLLFKYYWVINNTNHIYTTVGNNNLHQKYFTQTLQTLSNGSFNDFVSDGYGNDLKFNLNDLYLGVEHKFRKDILTLKYGVKGHFYYWEADQSTSFSKHKFLLLPHALLNLEFLASEKLNFSYEMGSNFMDATKYANGLRLSGYNSVFKGNEILENELYHKARLWYSKFSMYRGIMANAAVNFRKKVESIRNEVLIDGINYVNSPISTNNPETQWNIDGQLKKNIKQIYIKGKVNFSWFNYEQEVNNARVKNESNNQLLGIEFGTNFKKLPNFELGYNKGFNKYSGGNSETEAETDNPYINMEYIFFKDFVFKADYEYTKYNNNLGQKETYEIANLSLLYQKEDSAWTFEIKGSNIFDTEYKVSNFYNDFIVSEQKTYIMPRIGLFTVTYKL